MSEADSALPRVFVVTPSLNQARFLRATIESVLAQRYPALDYFVADGGSTDGSVDILASYGTRVRWVSAPDGGQAAAIATAWQRTDAPIVAWLNSDDLYEPEAVRRAVDVLLDRPEAAVVYGRARSIDAAGNPIGSYPTRPFDSAALFHSCFVSQPAAFVHREAIAAPPLPDARLHYCMDYDLWIRLSRDGCRFEYLAEDLAAARVHPACKTVARRDRAYREIIRMVTHHYGLPSRNWSVGSLIYRSERLLTRLGWLPPRWRHRIQDRQVRRAERALVGPMYADGWAGTRTRLEVTADAAGRVRLNCEAPFWPYRRPLRVAAVCDGRVLARHRVDEPGPFVIDLALPAGSHAREQIELRASRTFLPKRWGYAPDARPLSFLVRSIEPTARLFPQHREGG